MWWLQWLLFEGAKKWLRCCLKELLLSHIFAACCHIVCLQSPAKFQGATDIQERPSLLVSVVPFCLDISSCDIRPHTLHCVKSSATRMQNHPNHISAALKWEFYSGKTLSCGMRRPHWVELNLNGDRNKVGTTWNEQWTNNMCKTVHRLTDVHRCAPMCTDVHRV